MGATIKCVEGPAEQKGRIHFSPSAAAFLLSAGHTASALDINSFRYFSLWEHQVGLVAAAPHGTETYRTSIPSAEVFGCG